MSIERDNKYYNEYYSESIEYRKHYSESAYFELWKKVVQLIPNVEINILDVGCGAGQFGQMLCESHDQISYAGFDFSHSAIDLAKKNIPARFHYGLKCGSLYDYVYGVDSLIVCLEVMEHICDFDFLNKIPLGVEVIFTVPDFDQPSHVRYFKTVAEIVFRYHTHLQFSHIEKVGSWFICKAVRA